MDPATYREVLESGIKRLLIEPFRLSQQQQPFLGIWGTSQTSFGGKHILGPISQCSLGLTAFGPPLSSSPSRSASTLPTFSVNSLALSTQALVYVDDNIFSHER